MDWLGRLTWKDVGAAVVFMVLFFALSWALGSLC